MNIIFKLQKFKFVILGFLKPKSKFGFLLSHCRKRRLDLLDIGCGNESNKVFLHYPNVKYKGVDIFGGMSVETDEIILFPKETFCTDIRNLGRFDVVISSHNIEHVNNLEDYVESLRVICKVGSFVFISTPSTRSLDFPEREGTLNFYDDPTHRIGGPIDLFEIFNKKESEFSIEYYTNSYRPKLLALIGWLFEFLSKSRKRLVLGTSEYYGFEQIIILKVIA